MTVVTLIQLATVPAFLYAAWSDYKHHKVPWNLWPILSAIGVALLGFVTMAGQTQPVLVASLSVAFFAALSYILRSLGTFGGADMWALLTASVLYPVPVLSSTALTAFPITVFTNSVLFTVIYKGVLLLRGSSANMPYLVPFTAGLISAILVGDYLLLLA